MKAVCLLSLYLGRYTAQIKHRVAQLHRNSLKHPQKNWQVVSPSNNSCDAHETRIPLGMGFSRYTNAKTVFGVRSASQISNFSKRARPPVCHLTHGTPRHFNLTWNWWNIDNPTCLKKYIEICNIVWLLAWQLKFWRPALEAAGRIRDSVAWDQGTQFLAWINEHAWKPMCYRIIHLYIHTHTYKCTYLHTYIQTYVHAYIQYMLYKTTCMHACIDIEYITWHYTTLHSVTLHYTTLHYTASCYIILHYIALHYIELHCIALHYIELHCIALH